MLVIVAILVTTLALALLSEQAELRVTNGGLFGDRRINL